MVRKADSKMVLSAKCNYVQNYINPASNGVTFLISKTVHKPFHNVFGRAHVSVCMRSGGCLFASLRLNTYPDSFPKSGHGHNNAKAGSTD